MNNTKEKISVVIPVYNEVESLFELHRQLCDALDNSEYDYNLIFVDDGSKDGSVEVEEKLACENKNIIVEKLIANQGKAAALNRGFQIADGDYVATIDGDLQDDPYAIPDMVKQIKETGVDLVSGWKQDRKDKFIKKHTSKIYNFFTRILTGIKLHDTNNGLKVYKSIVVKNVVVYGEMHRYIPVLAKQQGFTSGEMKVRHFERKYGETKYGISRFWRGFFDLITIKFVTEYFKRPMHFFGAWGTIFISGGILAEVYILVLKFGFGHSFQLHIAMLLLGALMIILGIQMFSIGLICELITYFNKNK
ncbi:MAG: glycosyltransferase family 2 protein [Candidatus Marinimicrobia bacterium]|nr:glycosyltransferase family 2 protein [Candidatus Neomarinimicrobiota bacterium]